MKNSTKVQETNQMKHTAKEISISKYLISQGFSPKRERPGESWFSSPLRTGDKDPSFKVDESKNLWYDFGSGTGGSIIDLAMAYHNFTFLEAVAHLESHRGTDLSFTRQDSLRPPIVLLEAGALRSRYLLNYLGLARSLNLQYARLYTQEIRYQIGVKTYVAIGFPNDLGGFELRNAYFKGGISPKYFTTVEGSPEGINLFEGFVDFLSLLTYYQVPSPTYRTIILNSLTNVSKLPDLTQFARINLYLDNDKAGLAAASKLLEQYPQAVNQSALLFPEQKDVNDFIISRFAQLLQD